MSNISLRVASMMNNLLMDSFSDIINSIEKENPCINPTIIYNEGWMTRLLVFQSLIEKTVVGKIDFSRILNWTSEALISSPFVHAKDYKEGYTHADIAFGDFSVNYEKRGEIIINKDAKIFGIIEAKMGSNLSQRTTHVDDYNQASRNLACIAYNTIDKIDCETFFTVVAPESMLIKHSINKQIQIDNLIGQIEKRYNLYPQNEPVRDQIDLILAKAWTCKIESVSYQDWIDKIVDIDAKNYLQEFYDKAKKWNRLI